MRRCIPLLTSIFFLSGLITPAHAEVPTPAGFSVTERKVLGNGLTHIRLYSSNPPMAVNVARMTPASSFRLVPVLSNESLAGDPPMERTSSMCLRLMCQVAINGDFYFPASGLPVGAQISAGEMMRSPSSSHHQLIFDADGRPSTGSIEWKGSVVSTDLVQIPIDGLNVGRLDDQIVLYTSRYGGTTATNRFGAEITGRLVGPTGPLRLGQTSVLKLESIDQKMGNSYIPPGGFVLSGHGTGANALLDLWTRIDKRVAAPEVFVRTEASSTVTDSIGGTPILVREGRRWFQQDGSVFAAGRHPRTLVGWNSDGEILLVTIDGRQNSYSIGMSLNEAADFMISLGATEAINLDGGGSTTFVVGGQVINNPSDKAVRRGGREQIVSLAKRGDAVVGSVERPVANAIVVVPDTGSPLGSSTLDSRNIPVPPSLPLPPPTAADPGSVPYGALPALLAEQPSSNGPLLTLAVLMLALAVIAVGWRLGTSSSLRAG